MTLGHLHLIGNHVPMLGTIFGILILLNAHFRKSMDILRVALKMFILAAVFTVPVFFTGDYAASEIRDLPTFSKALSDAHENAATVSYVLVVIMGLLAIWGMYQLYKKSVLPSWFTKVLLLIAVVSAASFIYTGKTGGQVNHPELRPGYVAPPFQEEDD